MLHERGPHLKLFVPQKPNPLRLALEGFLISREAMRATPSTLDWYRRRLGKFLSYVEEHGANAPEGVTSHHIRTFLVELQHQDLSDWYIHGHARAIKTFLRFLHAEAIIPDNPMQRVTMPRLDKPILPALSPEDVKHLLDVCHSARDKAIVLCLVDTGCRASEFVALDVEDVDIKSGSVRVQHGKGRKDRVTFLGAKARKALLRYLMPRAVIASNGSLWLSENTGERLTHSGLRLLLQRLGKRAGVANCSPHTFRRTCALWSLRSGMNIYALQQLMGHSDLTVLRRYLALVEEDLQEAHRKHGAVDNMLLT